MDFINPAISCSFSSHKPAFIFIANLAAADILLVFVEILAAWLQTVVHDSEILLQEYDMDLTTNQQQDDDVVERRKTSCRLQIGLWIFGVAHTLTATLMLTIDRYEQPSEDRT